MKTAEPKSSVSTASSLLQRKGSDAGQPFFQKENGERAASFFGEKNNDSASTTDGPFFQKNQATTTAPSVQPKLKIGSPDDPLERQADSVADRVVNRISQPAPAMAATAAPSVQAKCADCEKEEKLQKKEEETGKTEEKLQRKPIFESGSEPPPDENTVHRKADGGGGEATASPDFSTKLNSSKGGGQPLADSTRSEMESGFGADFSGVRVHSDSSAAGMSHDIGAQAFTHGSDIYFNEGKYDTHSTDGKRLLAHELTHTVQQGGAAEPAVSKKESDLVQRDVAAAAPTTAPQTPVDISNGFDPSPEWRAWIKAQKKSSQIPVAVKAGNNYAGTLFISRSNQGTQGDAQDYTLTTSDGYAARQFLEISGIPIFDELKQKGIEAVVVIEAWPKKQPQIKGYLSVKTAKGMALVGGTSFIGKFNESLEMLGYLGIKKPKLPTVENHFEQGRLTMKTTSPMTTVVAGFLEAGMSLGIVNSVMTFEVNATVDIKGLVSGKLDLRRDENGQFGGKVEIQANVQNVAATVTAEYVKTPEGAADVTIQGKGKVNSEKFEGEVGFIVAQEAKANALMKAQLGVQSIEEQAQKEKKPAKTPPNSKGNMVLVGWGTVTATITPWLKGTAKVGVDNKGQFTIVGEIVVPGEVKLMEEKGKKVPIFKIEVKGGYGIPVIGQVGLFASIELFMNAGFGPLVLKNVGFTGTYSTDPTVLQNFKITGTLGINAFAILGLTAEAGVFLTLIGHDIKAGLSVTAAAGIRAYAEATPTFEYVEQGAPTGGKVGESWLRGHFEAAAQLFLQLGGEFFVAVDSPWWSPLGDERWTYPLGQVTYPLGNSLGIGGDVAWKVGSPEAPELKFAPVEFDPDKFTADVMADPPPGKGKGGDKHEQGKFEDGSAAGNLEAKPGTKPGGPGLDGKKKEDLTKLPDEQRFLRACNELGDMAKASQSHPSTYKVMEAKAQKIKTKYAIEEVTLKGDKKGDSLKVFVKHKDRDTKKRESIEVHLMSEAERMKLIKAAADDLETRISGKKDAKTQAISHVDAEAIAAGLKKGHPVLEAVEVVDGGEVWKFKFDLGDVEQLKEGAKKAESKAEGDISKALNGKTTDFEMNGASHTLFLVVKDGNVEVEMASNFRGKLRGKILTAQDSLKNSKHPQADEAKAMLTKLLGILKDLEDDMRAIVQGVHVKNKTAEQVNTEAANVASILKAIGQEFKIKDLTDLGHLSEYVNAVHQINLEHPKLKGYSLGEAIRKKLYPSWDSNAISWKDARLTTIYDPSTGFSGHNAGLKYVFNGKTFFVSQQSGSEIRPDETTKDLNGRRLDLFVIARASVDHVSPAVSEQWNSKGNNTNQADRDAFYNDTSNLEVISREKNSSMGGDKYKPDVGENFRGPGE